MLVNWSEEDLQHSLNSPLDVRINTFITHGERKSMQNRINSKNFIFIAAKTIEQLSTNSLNQLLPSCIYNICSLEMSEDTKTTCMCKVA